MLRNSTDFQQELTLLYKLKKYHNGRKKFREIEKSNPHRVGL